VAIGPDSVPLLRLPLIVVNSFLTVNSCQPPFCHFVHWELLVSDGNCARDGCKVHVRRLPNGSGRHYTATEQPWCCAHHYLHVQSASPICKAPIPSCPDPNHLWNDLLQLLTLGAVGYGPLLRCCYVASFHALCVRETCVPWAPTPSVFLPDCPYRVCEDVHHNIAAFISMVGASGIDVWSHCAQPLRLLDWFRLVCCYLDPSRVLGDAEAEALSEHGVVPRQPLFFSFFSRFSGCSWHLSLTLHASLLQLVNVFSRLTSVAISCMSIYQSCPLK
jgi:hypothetical protein